MYRMPSTHASAVAYMATYIVMATIRLHLPASLGWMTEVQERSMRIAGSGIAVMWAVLVTGSRLYLGWHTLHQILAGVAFGVVFAIASFMAYVDGLDKAFARLADALV